MNSSYINVTTDYLSWIPRLDENDDDNVVKTVAFLSLAMITTLLFSLLMCKFQRQLLKHHRRANGLDCVYKVVKQENVSVVHETST